MFKVREVWGWRWWQREIVVAVVAQFAVWSWPSSAAMYPSVSLGKAVALGFRVAWLLQDHIN